MSGLAVLLAGGVGGARFLRGLRAHLDRTPDLADSTVTVIGNTGDDINLFGLRVCPDLDTILYTLGGGVHEGQGWGRADETHRVQGELAAYGALPQWFALGDQDFGTHIVRSQWLGQGLSLSEVTARLAERWGLPGRGITLLPMTDSPVETHVVVDEGEGPRAVHFQEWWVRMQAAVPASRFVAVGMDRATAAPGVLDAIRQAAEKIRRGDVADASGLSYADLLQIEELPISDTEPLRAQLDAFVSSVVNGTPPEVTVEDGLAAVETAVRIVQAIALQKL